jgi:hypothetical protein
MAKNKRRARRPRQGQAPGIDKKKYDQIFRYFLEDQNIKSVARKCGLDPRTVRKYVEHGDPRRGLEPIRDRYARIVRKAQEREDADIAKAVASNLALVRDAKKVLVAKLHEQLAPDGKTLTTRASEELPADISAYIDRIVRLEMSLLGGPDLKVETMNKFEGWTQEEIFAFATSGKRPRGKGGPGKNS